jgi:dTDP-4-amino-4,6-dideoxygalactose transaminase
MNLSSLAPTGNPIVCHASDERYQELFPKHRLIWVDSGTSALAWSLLHIKAQRGAELARPKVIVPGYCCPDLLAAALFAGYDPVIVDIDVSDPSYCIKQLQEAITAEVIAIIAINFLGVKERLAELSAVAIKAGIAIIEDNAQWFPDDADEAQLTGDYVTFSFGRGKAISLLGGGLVAVKNSEVADVPKLAESVSDRFWFLKVQLYHLLTNRYFYYWLEKVTFLGLGSTVFHPLTEISALSDKRKGAVWRNVVEYSNRSRENESLYLQGLINNQMGAVLASARRGRLLRFPYLFRDQETRDKAYEALKQQGLGGSKMYGEVLYQIDGVASLGLTFPILPNAKNFAKRFLTLPTHQGVDKLSALRIVEIINHLEA